jgi:iron-sulfur cluster repair protein YtfE (RIC family)
MMDRTDKKDHEEAIGQERGSGFAQLIPLARKVALVHGTRHPELEELASLVAQGILSPASDTENRRILSSIRNLASGFIPPTDACNSYRTLLRGLEAMETATLARLEQTGDSLKKNNPGEDRAAAADAPRADSCCGT